MITNRTQAMTNCFGGLSTLSLKCSVSYQYVWGKSPWVLREVLCAEKPVGPEGAEGLVWELVEPVLIGRNQPSGDGHVYLTRTLIDAHRPVT